jgi:1,5-anhydro-D-fructose reductase (1,5-anhydro-D-mannitol-forming)
MFRVAMLSRWHVHAGGYANEVSDVPGVLVTAVWDEQPDRGREWAGQLGVAFEPDYEKLLARPDVDGVLVCSPTSMHRELIVAAARAGKHIFTEKVLAFTLKDALEIAGAVKKAGVKFTISYPRICWGSNIYMKRALDAGFVGAPTLMLVRTSHNGATGGWLPDSFFDEREAGGGAMMDFGAHPMYLARWMLGRPVRITSMFSRFTEKPLDDNDVCTIEFENRALAVLQSNFVCDRCPNSLEVHGVKGSMYYMDSNKPLTVSAENAPVDEDGLLLPEALPETLPSPLEQWAAACLHDAPLPAGCGIDEAVQLTELMEGAYKSFKEKRVVEFAELGK